MSIPDGAGLLFPDVGGGDLQSTVQGLQRAQLCAVNSISQAHPPLTHDFDSYP